VTLQVDSTKALGADVYMKQSPGCELPVLAHFPVLSARKFRILRHSLHIHQYASWRRGIVVSGVHRMNEVNARRARLVPGWVTVFGRVYHLGM